MLSEGLILLALLVIVAVPLACAIMLIIVLDRQKHQRSQLDNLQMTLRAVLRMTRRGREGATADSREEAVAPGSEHDVEAEEVTAPPTPAAEGPVAEESEEPAAPAPPRAVPEQLPKLEEPFRAAPAAVSVEESREPGKFEQAARDIVCKVWSWIVVWEEHRPANVSVEFAVASNWLLRLGIVIVVVGVGFFLKYSVELLSPRARVSLSILAGLAMIGTGTRLLKGAYHLLGQGLLGGGLAVLYFSIFAAFNYYGFLSQYAAFGLMGLVTVAAGVLAMRFDPRLIRRRVETTESTVERQWKADIADLVTKDDNSVELLVNVPEELDTIVGLTIETPLRNFDRSVTVSGRVDENAEWDTLATGELLYDYSRFADVRNSKICFQGGAFERIKVEIHAVTDVQASRLSELRQTFTNEGPVERTEIKALQRRPFRIDSVHLLTQHTRRKEKSRAVREYEAAKVNIERDDSHATVADIRTYRQPLTAIRVKTGSRNFSRQATVEIIRRGDVRTLGRGQLYDLSYRDIQERDVTVNFPETRAKRLRLSIVNGDNPTLPIDGVELLGHVYEVVFLAAPDANYRLYYGSPDAGEPIYDTTAIKRLLREGYGPVTASLQTQESNQLYEPDSRGFLDSKLFFVIVIVLMVAVLGFALYVAVRQA